MLCGLHSPLYSILPLIFIPIFSNLTVAEVQSWAESFERLMSSLSKYLYNLSVWVMFIMLEAGSQSKFLFFSPNLLERYFWAGNDSLCDSNFLSRRQESIPGVSKRRIQRRKHLILVGLWRSKKRKQSWENRREGSHDLWGLCVHFIPKRSKLVVV